MKKYFVRKVTYVGGTCEGRREEIVNKFETFQEAIDYLKLIDKVDYTNDFAITRVKHYGDLRVYYTASLY